MLLHVFKVKWNIFSVLFLALSLLLHRSWFLSLLVRLFSDPKRLAELRLKSRLIRVGWVSDYVLGLPEATGAVKVFQTEEGPCCVDDPLQLLTLCSRAAGEHHTDTA